MPMSAENAAVSAMMEVLTNGAAADAHADAPDARPGSPLGLSMRLVRDLLAADHNADELGEDRRTRASRLLGATLAALRLSAGALLDHDHESGHLAPLATRNLPQGVIMPSAEAGTGRSLDKLAARAIAERRVFISDPAANASASALLSEQTHASWAVIPLFDQAIPVGALLLALRRGGLVKPSTVRGLFPGFHLLAILITRGRGAGTEDDASGAEMHDLELQELTTRVHEAEEAARGAREQASSAAAELRAEVEAARARIAELEASVAQGGIELARRVDEEEMRARIDSACVERDRRIAELEEALAAANARSRNATVPAVAVQAAAPESDAPSDPTAAEDGEAEAAATLIDDQDGSLLDLAGEAAAAIDENGETDASSETEDAPADEALAASESAPDLHLERLALIHLDRDPETREVVQAAATGAGATLWSADGTAPAAATTLLVVNLFSGDLTTAAELAATTTGEVRTICYSCDRESGSALLIGPSEILRRPIDVPLALAQLRRSVPGKLERVVIVSSQLRELAGLREALSAAGTSSSVACDARQAVDILEIIRRPDAFVIDLALERGDGLFLAEHLRGRGESERLPIGLLLPGEIDPERLIREAPPTSKEIEPVMLELKRLIAGAAAACV